MGSKSRIKKYIVTILQRCIDDNDVETYIETFCGGCNVIDSVICNQRIAADKNRYLISLLTYMQMFEEYPKDTITREHYNSVREAYYKREKGECEVGYADWYIGFVGFLASYNGRFFDGGYAQAGYEKCKNGKTRYRDYFKETLKNLEEQLPLLMGIHYIVSDYKDFVMPEQTCVCYCDPPYYNTKQYKTASDFDYTHFWQSVRVWSAAHFVFVSEENAPEDFVPIWEQKVSRSIKAQAKSVAVEKLYVLKNSKAHKWFLQASVF